MTERTTCPRCGARDSFMKGYLPETCVCRVCQSQLDWREIPGCGPDCTAVRGPDEGPTPEETTGDGEDTAGDQQRGADGLVGGKGGDWDV